jgi:DNA-binding MarR family transcriptional regulator
MSNSFPVQPHFSAAILAAPESRLYQLEALVRDCGCLLRQYGDECDFLLIARPSEMDRDGRVWSEIADYLQEHDSEALVWSDLEEIDAAYAALPADRCHFFLDSADWQAVAVLTGVARQVRKYRMHDSSRKDETVALHRISNELADFARTLARIADQDDDSGGVVRDKPVGFRPAPQGLFDGLEKLVTTAAPKPLNVRSIIKLRRMRDRFFEPALFADPGWDILLDLFAAQEEGKAVSVSSLCIAASVPPTTALRWITNMTEAGLLVRVQDPGDARRVFIELSENARRQMQAYFEAIGSISTTAI